MRTKNAFQHILAHRGDCLGDAVAVQQVVALLIDHLALIIGDVVVLQQLFTDIEVVRLDLALRILDRATNPGMFDRLALLHAQLLHQPGHFFGSENTHQAVFHRQVKSG